MLSLDLPRLLSTSFLTMSIFWTAKRSKWHVSTESRTKHPPGSLEHEYQQVPTKAICGEETRDMDVFV